MGLHKWWSWSRTSQGVGNANTSEDNDADRKQADATRGIRLLHLLLQLQLLLQQKSKLTEGESIKGMRVQLGTLQEQMETLRRQAEVTIENANFSIQTLQKRLDSLAPPTDLQGCLDSAMDGQQRKAEQQQQTFQEQTQIQLSEQERRLLDRVEVLEERMDANNILLHCNLAKQDEQIRHMEARMTERLAKSDAHLSNVMERASKAAAVVESNLVAQVSGLEHALSAMEAKQVIREQEHLEKVRVYMQEHEAKNRDLLSRVEPLAKEMTSKSEELQGLFVTFQEVQKRGQQRVEEQVAELGEAKGKMQGRMEAAMEQMTRTDRELRKEVGEMQIRDAEMKEGVNTRVQAALEATARMGKEYGEKVKVLERECAKQQELKRNDDGGKQGEVIRGVGVRIDKVEALQVSLQQRIKMVEGEGESMKGMSAQLGKLHEQVARGLEILGKRTEEEKRTREVAFEKVNASIQTLHQRISSRATPTVLQGHLDAASSKLRVLEKAVGKVSPKLEAVQEKLEQLEKEVHSHGQGQGQGSVTAGRAQRSITTYRPTATASDFHRMVNANTGRISAVERQLTRYHADMVNLENRVSGLSPYGPSPYGPSPSHPSRVPNQGDILEVEEKYSLPSAPSATPTPPTGPYSHSEIRRPTYSKVAEYGTLIWDRKSSSWIKPSQLDMMQDIDSIEQRKGPFSRFLVKSDAETNLQNGDAHDTRTGPIRNWST
mmetsp:Transcript_46156/g.76897  ORF Transcript_46156/g.76897 Transcript_46156/m.76897 type:complete len:717 (-) Transcript_46156:249-2399(-)